MTQVNNLEEAMVEIRNLEKNLIECTKRCERAWEEVWRLQYRLSNYENKYSVSARHLTVSKGGKAV